MLLCAAFHVASGQTPDQATVLQWLRQAGAAVQRGDLVAGEALFRKVTEAAPNLSDGYLGLGMTQLREGHVDDAIQSLRKATELNPKLPGAHMFLGIAEYQADRTEDALGSLKEEVALEPNNVEALTWLGIIELAQGHPEQATSPLDQAVALAPRDANVLYYRGRAHQMVAEESYRSLHDLDPDSVFVHRGLADTLANSGQPEKAIAEYEAAIQKQPDNPDLYEALGEQEQKVSRVDAAEAAYRAELKLSEHSAIALYNLGKIYVEHGKASEGIPLLRRAQQAHASAAPTDFYLGLGLAETDQNQEAAQWLEQAVNSSPSPFIQQSAYYQLVRVYQRLNRKEDAQRALEELKKLKTQAAKSITAGQDGTEGSPNSPGNEHQGQPPR
jgi:tetratricopeptide (TPR) repeat protein